MTITEDLESQVKIKVPSYPTILQLGHRALEHLLKGEIIIEEKCDGSQFSFQKIDGEVFYRSKGVQIPSSDVQKLFKMAVNTVEDIKPLLHEGWIYRGEAITSPRHNTLKYDRIPRGGIILFDVTIGHDNYLSYEEKMLEANRLGLDVVPLLYKGTVGSLQLIKSFLDRDSCLGGTKIEGIVIKNYSQFNIMTKTIAIGKFVREDFKEENDKNWKKIKHTEKIDVQIIAKYNNINRWRKTYEHLRDSGLILHEMKDIKLLIPEVAADIKKECEEEIKEALWNYYIKEFNRGWVSGLPEWYKQLLAERSILNDLH